MKFRSTRGGSDAVTLSGAILEGIAPDGGLFVPERLPAVSLPDFPRSASLSAIAGASSRRSQRSSRVAVTLSNHYLPRGKQGVAS